MSIDFEAIGQAYGVSPEVVELIVKAAQVDRRGAMGAGALPPPSGDPSRTVDRIAVCYPWGDLTAELVRDGAQRNWILRKGGSDIRHLNQYENNYVNSAIAATTAAMLARPTASGAAVLSDTARLDWLVSQGADIEEIGGNRYRVHWSDPECWQQDLHTTPRAAIDAARAAATGEKGGSA